MPLAWAFRRDPHDTGLARGWAYTDARAQGAGAWETLSSDVYIQGQGILLPDGQSFLGYWWYQSELDLDARQVKGPVHLMFPGLFNDCWLYVNGALVAHRDYKEPWWRTDYRFEWDVDLTAQLKAGKNLITRRGFNVHHFGGGCSGGPFCIASRANRAPKRGDGKPPPYPPLRPTGLIRVGPLLKVTHAVTLLSLERSRVRSFTSMPHG